MSNTVASLTLAIALSVLSRSAHAQTNDDREEWAVLRRINAYRAEHGLAPLARSAALDRAAQGHSADMPARGYFGHDDDPDGASPFDRMAREGYRGGYMGENLAAGNSDEHATFELASFHLWMSLKNEEPI